MAFDPANCRGVISEATPQYLRLTAKSPRVHRPARWSESGVLSQKLGPGSGETWSEALNLQRFPAAGGLPFSFAKSPKI